MEEKEPPILLLSVSVVCFQLLVACYRNGTDTIEIDQDYCIRAFGRRGTDYLFIRASNLSRDKGREALPVSSL
jgi:hypothetical protein